MKGILKFLCAAVLTLTLFGLVSCGKEAGVPDGMQLVRGGEEYGYNFYAPEEWVVSSYGEFASAYISVTNNSSITFGEASMPDYGKDDGGFDEADAVKYFNENMDNLDYMKSREITVNAEKCAFGNEQNAYKFIYTYSYENADGSKINYRAMQILAARADRLYIFLYNSQNTAPAYAEDGVTFYEIYLEKVNEVVSAFRFLDTPPVKAPITAGSSGELTLVSDRKICGFDFYAPADSLPVATSALVHRNLGGGSSVSISELVSNSTSTHPDEYFDGIRSNMQKSFGEIEYQAPEKDSNKREVKGAMWAYFYEYSYSYAGVKYKGCTVLIQTGTNSLNAKAYILTYTAPTGSYDGELLTEMLDRLEF